jgi:hypothetical protein
MAIIKFSPTVHEIFVEFVPIIQKLAGEQRYAISVGGSLGKGTWDQRSDIDFRLFTDQKVISRAESPESWAAFDAAVARWKQQGVNIDGIWARTVAEINAGIDAWFGGESRPADRLWTIWGYYLLTDIHNQHVIEDPYDLIGAWKTRLSRYPLALKQSILKKTLNSLRYWRADYHYAHKVERCDEVFLAGMSTKLVHEMIEVLFALNEMYFVGDGSNLTFVEKFQIVPPDFSARVRTILYPQGPDALVQQYSQLMALIDEVLGLAEGF